LDEPYKREHPTNAQLCHPSFISNLLEMNRISTFTITILVLSLLFSGLHCRQNQAVYEDNAFSSFLSTDPLNSDHHLATVLSSYKLYEDLVKVNFNVASSTKQDILDHLNELISILGRLGHPKATEYLNQVRNHIVNDNYEEVTELKATTGAFVNSQINILPYIPELLPFYNFLLLLSKENKTDTSILKRASDLLEESKDSKNLEVSKSKMKNLLNEMSKMEEARSCSGAIQKLSDALDSIPIMDPLCQHLGGLLSYVANSFAMN